jgi:hypothetical protein
MTLIHELILYFKLKDYLEETKGQINIKPDYKHSFFCGFYGNYDDDWVLDIGVKHD